MHKNDINVPLVVTYCNKYKETNYENTRRLVATLKNNNWDHVVLGEGECWENYTTKVKAYRKYLETLHPDKIVVISDAHDVYCLRNVHYFVEEFRALQKPIVVSMELFAEGRVNYNPTQQYSQVEWLGPYYEHHGMQIKPDDHVKKYVNSGLMCGYAKNLMHLNEWTIQHGFIDDQKATASYANAHPDEVHLDVNANMLHTCTSSVNFGLHAQAQHLDSPSFSELFGHSAYFLHIPGLHCGGGQPILYDVVHDVLQKYNPRIAVQIPTHNYNYVKFKDYHESEKKINT
jgi:hypothetical protein